MTGTMLQAVVQSYFSLNDTQDEVQERQQGVINNAFMSFGTFSTNIQGVYSWGVLRNAKFSGMMMDIDRLSATAVDKSNQKDNLIAFAQQQGMRQSLNENQVPEMFFNDPKATQKNVEGISAVKALKLASEQGQKIYQIDSKNINTVMPLITHDAEVTQDIRNAVASGKVVTVSEKSINFNGWNGSGYIIFDPNTGSGAYMISGGANGGVTSDTPAWKVLLGVGLGALVGAGLIAAFAPLIWIYVAIALMLFASLILACAATNYYQNTLWADTTINVTGALVGLAAGLFGGVFGAVVGLAYAQYFTMTGFSSKCLAA